MRSQSFFSNNRPITLQEAILITVAFALPESAYEPTEISNFRKRAELAFQVSQEIPGSILDSQIYEYLKRKGS